MRFVPANIENKPLTHFYKFWVLWSSVISDDLREEIEKISGTAT
nr:MAG TPA: hypothetical protein [Caudoviricetes sp.]